MDPNIWKVEINLRKKNGPVVTTSTRTESGRVLRTSGIIADDKSVKMVVEQAFKAFAGFDEKAFQRVHYLAQAEAKLQLDEQDESEQE